MGMVMLGIAVVIVVGVLLYARTRPDDFRVERHIVIEAPPQAIYPLIENFRQWQAWSPYEHLDPAMQRRHDGPASGLGAVYAWDGSAKAGAGRMEIIRADAPSHVAMQLDFSRPFEGHYIAEFMLEPQVGGTTVRWKMHGANAYMSKLMGLFFNMDRMIGKDFEKGLAALKALVEK